MAQGPINENERPVEALQKCFSFLRDNLHTDKLLLDHLFSQSILSDEDKDGLKDGKEYMYSTKLLKSILRSGTEDCRRFIDVLKQSQLWTQFKEQLTKEAESGDVKMTMGFIRDHRKILLLEMEPSLLADLLLEKFLLDIKEHDEVEGICNRKRKCQVLLSFLEKHKDEVEKFGYELQRSKCFPAMVEMKDAFPDIPDNPMDCLRWNYRSLCRSICKQNVYDYLVKNNVPILQKDCIPTKCRIIKAALQTQEGCRILLNYIANEEIPLFYKVAKRYWLRKQRERRHIKFFIEPEQLHCEFDFLLSEVEPIPLSDILLEEKIFSVSEHDKVQSEPSRKKQAEYILWHLKNHFNQPIQDNLGYCFDELGWVAVIGKLKRKESPLEDSVELKSTGQEEEGFIILKPDEAGIQCAYEGNLPSNFDLTISLPHMVDESKLAETIKLLNRDSALRSRLSQLSHMVIEKAESSLTLHLSTLTDEAGKRFLANHGRLIEEVVKTVLDMVDCSEKLYEAKEPLKLQVKLTEATSSSKKKDDTSDVQCLIQLKIQENWEILIEELEPCQMLACFKKKGLLMQDDERYVLELNERQARVEALLRILLKKSNSRMLQYFVQLLKQMDKTELAEKFDSGDVNIVHQEAEMVRKCLLLHFQEALEEIDSYTIEETLRKCGETAPENIKPRSGFSRRGRAYQFLMFVFENDALVLELKNVLEDRGLGHFFSIFLADVEEDTKDKDIKADGKELREQNFFSCNYILTLKDGYQPRHGHMDMDFFMDREDFLEYPEHLLHGYERGTERMFRDPLQGDFLLKRKMMMMMMGIPSRRNRMRYRKAKTDVPVTFEPEKKNSWPVVAALDFGTTYSGFAFSDKDNPLDIVAGKWNSSDLLESPKIPTSLLLGASGELVAFGYEAEKRFRELVEEDQNQDFRFFNRLKMELHADKSLDETLEVFDHLGRPKKALEVVSIAIKYLCDQCMKMLTEKGVKKDDVLWVVTVPAIWDDFAKQFMRKAAEKAGIPRCQLKLAFEPEAAAIYIVKGSRTDLTSESINKYGSGTQILLVDLGGGTADFSLMGVTEDQRLKELHQASGGAWGGNTINAKVWKILEDILGENVIKEFKKQTSDFMEMESNIELKKRDLSAENKLLLRMYPSLSEICNDLSGKTYKQLVAESQYADVVKVRTGKIIFETEIIDKIFERTLTESFAIMEKLLKLGTKVEDIIMVGGFSDSEIIQKQFQKKFSDCGVIIPTDPGLAVLKGAVIFGHDDHLIKSRLCPHTYGVEVLKYFLSSDLEINKKVINGTAYRTGTFEKLVTIGDTVEVGKTVEREFFASSNTAKRLELKFYRTDKQFVQSVTEEGCECIGRLTVNLSGPPDGTDHLVLISLQFGETEITVRGLDKTSGQIVVTEIDFLGKNS
ncbi:uncharacterized protein LOC125681969 isoform X2 [Ostrea edulis]|uniref:uncharacterized protein LOC125681969 isoform X2 n=1 Tax=Ostrea edulis TaxID=37623 RepID=UPI00209577EF|nr:uncharacterized protein LOC125681969 isoform X2 [Ostrea edulis]XP_056010527.1 uncharacterized protein LOC125681969 isoform X2 [Ostrea edulis]XP_056010528.1 uncharacterized protein LOC125681969 isoform X2 [Ostrea edulis]XP_056010529.1 uncharacterized protein LOC125681969 isoform X2 [Ostrea edulis]